MEHYFSISPDDLQKKIHELADNSKKFTISVIGWDDGDHFIDICNESGGGIDTDTLKLINNIIIGYKISFKEFAVLNKKFVKRPSLLSSNMKVQFNYDIHIWINGHYLVYNYLLKKAYLKKLNWFAYILKKGIRPNWQK